MADRHSLRRPIDVVEKLVGSVLVVLAGAAALLALMIGSTVRGQLEQQAVRDAATSTPVTAELIEATAMVVNPSGGTTAWPKVSAEVRWIARDGALQQARTSVDAGLAAGAAVTVWLDDEGRPTHAPLTEPGAVLCGIVAGLGVGAVAAFVLLLAWWLVRRLSLAVNSRRWAEEWAAVEPQWRRELR